jgi:hypothetical protein
MFQKITTAPVTECADEPFLVSPGSLPSVPGAWLNAKNRCWRLINPGYAGAANIPVNANRSRVVIDAIHCISPVSVYFGPNTADHMTSTTYHHCIPAGTFWTMSPGAAPYTGPMQIGLMSESEHPAIVLEFSVQD